MSTLTHLRSLQYDGKYISKLATLKCLKLHKLSKESSKKLPFFSGLQKGGIYNHFKSKDEIALAAFDHSLALLKQKVLADIPNKNNAIDRLHALVHGFIGFIEHQTIVGGCPILNTAVESDDTHPELRLRAQGAINEIRALIGSIVELGVRQREIIATIDSQEVSIVIISTIEGALMLSKLYGSDTYLDVAIAHLDRYIETYRRVDPEVRS
jgi:TetR/AcrR family transcriptional regulator, transcriptional repressor for nem operon